MRDAPQGRVYPLLQEVYYETNGLVVTVEEGRVIHTRRIRREAHYPSERNYYLYRLDHQPPEGRTTLKHLKGAECPPLPYP